MSSPRNQCATDNKFNSRGAGHFGTGVAMFIALSASLSSSIGVGAAIGVGTAVAVPFFVAGARKMKASKNMQGSNESEEPQQPATDV